MCNLLKRCIRKVNHAMRKILQLILLAPIFSFSQFKDSKAVSEIHLVSAKSPGGTVRCPAVLSQKISTISVKDTFNRLLEGATVKVLHEKELSEPITLIANERGEVDLSFLKRQYLYRLEVSFVGYKTKHIPLKTAGAFTIYLERNHKQMDSVIITGNSYTKRKVCKITCINFSRCTSWISCQNKEEKRPFTNTTGIFPNPVSRNSFVTIRLSEGFEEQIQLVNSAGQIIQSMISDANKNLATIQLNGVAAGVYYVRLIKLNSQQFFTHKLIVQ